MHVLLIVYAAAAVLVARLVLLGFQHLTAPDRSVPGPWLARFTRFWYLLQVRAGNFHHANIALHKKYGPIVRVAPGWYSIDTPDKSVYGIGSKFPKSDWYRAMSHPAPENWTIFTLRDIKMHADERRKFQSLYSLSSLLTYESYVDNCVDIFKERLDDFTKSGETVELAHWLQCYAFDVIGAITYSKRFGFLDAGDDVGGIMAALKNVMRYGSLVGIYPDLHPLLYAVNEKIPGSGAAGRTYLMKVIRGRIAERMEARKSDVYKAKAQSSDDNSDAPKDFLDKLADGNERDPTKVTPYTIFAMGISNIIAGADTTAISLASTMYHLLTTPRVLAKLRNEVTEFRKETGKLSFKQTQEMPYLQAVLKEALRMHPAVGLPLWRVVPEGGAEVAGQFFPAGTKVGVNSWVTQYDTSVYGDDVHEFKPERWQVDGEQLEKLEANYLPFGLGSRTCMGRHISFLEMSKLIPELVANFDFKLVMPADQWKGIDFWFVKPEKLLVQVEKIKSV